MKYRIRILRVSKGRTRWADTAVADYAKRLTRRGRYEEQAVKPVSFRGDVEAVKEAEADRLLAALKPNDIVVAVDERGQTLDSHAFADLLQRLTLDGTVVFVVGGAYGLAPRIRERAVVSVRLSDMVMNHAIARVVLHEQLYRAITILDGVPYHH